MSFCFSILPTKNINFVDSNINPNNMRTYELGKKYELLVDHFYIDNGRCWFRLDDGEDFWKLNVPAFPFQEEGWEGKTIVCIVKRLDDKNGYPWFQQDLDEILPLYYEIGQSYLFSVIDSGVDSKGKNYYTLIDRTVDMTHRVYTDVPELKGLNRFLVNKIKDGYLSLSYVPEGQENITAQPAKASFENLNNPFGQEDLHHEWKASLVFSSKGNNQNGPDAKEQILSIMEAISAFQNTEGGLLYIGVDEKSASVCGIEKDYDYLSADGDTNTYHKNTDGFANKIECAVKQHLGRTALDYIKFEFYVQRSTGKIFCIIVIDKTPHPVFVHDKIAFKRSNKGHWALKGPEVADLVRFKDSDKSLQKEFSRPMPDDCFELNPNIGITKPSAVIKLDTSFKKAYHYMTFYRDNTFMYSMNSHASDSNVLDEVRFNKINGNLENSRDLLAKCTTDGHVQFLQAFDICKLGKPDQHIPFPLNNIATIKVVRKYDFLKVRFTDGAEMREKDIRVVSLFGQNTENELRGNIDLPKLKLQIKNKGNAMIPKGYTLSEVKVIKEVLPDDVSCICFKGSDSGRSIESAA